MLTLSVFSFNDQGIRFENRNGVVWVCLTDMAKASGKKVSHWQQLAATQELINTLQNSDAGIPASPVIEIVKGGNLDSIDQGTWATEEVAIDFAAWCNVGFRIWVYQQIKILMTTGKVELENVQQTRPAKPDLLDDAARVFGMLKSLDRPRLCPNTNQLKKASVLLN